MKKRFSITLGVLHCLILFVFLTLIASCGSEFESETTNDKDTSTSIRQNGWNSDLWDPITPCEASNLTFSISADCIGSPYESAIILGIEEYNSLGLTINFSPATIGEDADLVFDCRDAFLIDACGSATASVPFDKEKVVEHGGSVNEVTRFDSGGSIGGLIVFNINAEKCPCSAKILGAIPTCNFEPNLDCMFKKTVMHEIGHALGIAHNEEFDIAEPIDGTSSASFQPGSIFNSGPLALDNCEWCRTCEFSDDDILALESFYECPNIDVSLSVNDINPDPGQTIQVTSSPSGESAYEVWAIFEDIPTKFFVHSNCGTDPITTDFTLQNDALMQCNSNLKIYVVQCGTGTDEINLTLSNNITAGNAFVVNDNYPQLGETIQVHSAVNGIGSYKVNLIYSMSGQTQIQNVTEVNCDSSNDATVTLWTNPGLAYSTVEILLYKDQSIIGSSSFTVFP